MARRTTTGTRRTFSLNKFAFWLVIIIGIAMAAGAVCRLINFNNSARIFDWIKQVCFALAMFVPVILSYRHARDKSNAWFIVWIIFTVLIVFGLIMGLIALL